MKFHFLFFVLLITPALAFAHPRVEKDNEKELKKMEDSLCKIGPTIFTGNNDAKFSSNKKFLDLLQQTLNLPDAFDYPFDSLKFIANLIAPDNSFRIFNWDIPKDDGTYLYYGFLVVNENKTGAKNSGSKNKYTIYELQDHSDEIKNPELSILSPEKWYGALYYQIILTNEKDKKYYTLLGWDGNNSLTWKKILDAITFGKDGKPIFGEKKIFQRGASKRTSNRVIFEFRGEMVMALHWEADNKRIVFDHLAPEVFGAEGMYQFYSSDGSYDAYTWKKGKWVFKDDVKVANPKDPNDNKYIPPQGDQNPSGTNSNVQTDPNMKQKKKGLFHRRK